MFNFPLRTICLDMGLTGWIIPCEGEIYKGPLPRGRYVRSTHRQPLLWGPQAHNFFPLVVPYHLMKWQSVQFSAKMARIWLQNSKKKRKHIEKRGKEEGSSPAQSLADPSSFCWAGPTAICLSSSEYSRFSSSTRNCIPKQICPGLCVYIYIYIYISQKINISKK